MSEIIGWAKKDGKGYEVSSLGDRRFSALYARMPDGRTIEQWYQCDIKGYCIGGTDWKRGKGKPPIFPYPRDHLWQMYLSLWRLWAVHHGEELIELLEMTKQCDYMLKDSYATTEINQARALATILNEWALL